MQKRSEDVVEQPEKKVYAEPKLEREQWLQDVTEGELPVVTGALPA
jgi:hypothetical protein